MSELCRNIFSVYEKDFLLYLVENYKSILQKKESNKVTNNEKTRAWEEIRLKFNADSGTTNRTSKQLKTCYLNIKKRANASRQKFLMERKLAGGGKIHNKPRISAIYDSEAENNLSGLQKRYNNLKTIFQRNLKIRNVSGEDISSLNQKSAPLSEPCNSGVNLQDFEMSETVLPDMVSESHDKNVVIKQEVIETELGQPTVDDSTLATFCSAPSESSSSFTPRPSASTNYSHATAEPSVIESSLISQTPVIHRLDATRTESISFSDNALPPIRTQVSSKPVSNNGKDRSSLPEPKRLSCRKVLMKKNHRFPSDKLIPSNKVSKPPKDKFDVYGEFVALKLRDLDPRSCAFIQTAIIDLIFEVEFRGYLSDEKKSVFDARTSEFLESMPSPLPKEQSKVPSTIDSSPLSCQSLTPPLNTTPTKLLDSGECTISHSKSPHNVPAQTNICGNMNNGTDISSATDPKRLAHSKVFVKKNHIVPGGGSSWKKESSQSKGKFDIYGEFIASKLSDLDLRSCSFIQRAIGDLIFEAELGRYMSEREKSILAYRTNEFLKSMPSPTHIEENKTLPS